jgi:Tfp pilus assembly protein PilF
VKGSKESLRKAIEISPYHFKSIRSLAYIHLHEKHNTVAVNLIHEHDKYFQNSAKWLAFSYQILKKAGKARDLYPILERAIKLDSLETDAYRALYELHLEQFNFELAEKEYRNLQSIGGGTADSLQFYNKLEREVQNALGRYYYDGVDVGIRLLLNADPYNPQANYYMALTLYMKEDYEGAKKHLKMVNQMVDYLYSEVQAAFYDLKGKVYLETKDYRIAQGSFERANGNRNPDMIGFSMALYMQKNPNWLKYFKMGGDTRTLNADAMKRYEKMKKIAAKSGAYGAVERNR